MLKQFLAELAQNPKAAISLSAVTSGTSTLAWFLEIAGQLVLKASVIAAFVLTVIAIISGILDIIRKNRELKINAIKAELEIERLRRENEVR